MEVLDVRLVFDPDLNYFNKVPKTWKGIKSRLQMDIPIPFKNTYSRFILYLQREYIKTLIWNNMKTGKFNS